MTMDHGVQIKLLGPPALVCAPRAKRNRAECGDGTAPYGGAKGFRVDDASISYRATAGI